MPSPLAGSLLVRRMCVRSDIPGRTDHELVYMPDLAKRYERAGCPLAGERLSVHPPGCVSVTLDLEVFAQLLVADSTPLFQEDLHLLANERVALDRCRVVSLLVPDISPDTLGLL